MPDKRIIQPTHAQRLQRARERVEEAKTQVAAATTPGVRSYWAKRLKEDQAALHVVRRDGANSRHQRKLPRTDRVRAND